MNVWVLFVLIRYASGDAGGLANFQQEFKTREACVKGSQLITDRFQSSSNGVTTTTICIEVAQ